MGMIQTPSPAMIACRSRSRIYKMGNTQISNPVELFPASLIDDVTPLTSIPHQLPEFRVRNFDRWRSMAIARSEVRMLPPHAEKKLQVWIRSRHVICTGNFFIFETINYTAIDHFSECVAALGGSVISVDSIGKIWIGDLRPVLLYQIKASLHTPHHQLKQYWLKYGSFRTRFNSQI
jgi:phycoerythrin-associated linker protein